MNRTNTVTITPVLKNRDRWLCVMITEGPPDEIPKLESRLCNSEESSKAGREGDRLRGFEAEF